MKAMFEFICKLEGSTDLDIGIIRYTKIHKVLKAILKLNIIPKEEEFQFKARSLTLYHKCQKFLASEQDTLVTTNGANNEANEEAKTTPVMATNGVAESPGQGKAEEKATRVEEEAEVEW